MITVPISLSGGNKAHRILQHLACPHISAKSSLQINPNIVSIFSDFLYSPAICQRDTNGWEIMILDGEQQLLYTHSFALDNQKS